MVKNTLLILGLFISLCSSAQMPGDTIIVNTFNYGSGTRDSMIQFPNNPAIRYEKVLMLYNMRCKNGLVSPGIAGQTNIGCGEWDYSCNTYITDSSRVDSSMSTRASHTISNFTGSSFPYITTPYYNKYQYAQTSTAATIIAENQYVVGLGALSLNEVLNANQKSGRSQYLFTQAELVAAGVTTGNISGIILNALTASTVNFLKVTIKHTTQTSLNASTPEINGFTETYYANTTFTVGANRLQFNTPFNWDGLSNIIIDFSFTNSTPMAALLLQGSMNSSISGLYTNNDYYINTAGGIVGSIPTAPLSSISSQMTVAFWSRGNAGISSVATSIIEGADASMNRQLNIHLPWSNANIYYDCGNDGSGYDRIYNLATTPQLEQTWNHWAFTKNTLTGEMIIYLNGTLWNMGTGKTKLISTIDSMILGGNINKANPYLGDIDELSIWNTALNQPTIEAWMNKAIDPSHPDYGHLVAYYKLEEGAGLVSADASVNAQTAQFDFAPDWRFTRGDNLTRLFNETSNRPTMTFLQGTYALTNTNINVVDSLPASPNIVRTYSILSNAGTSQSDVYNLVNTSLYWNATFSYLYDGLTGAKIDSFVVAPNGTINISNLPYMDRTPSKYEIMSFVTPYGINLDMGMNGKTWTFDMTDFLPILNGSKRMSVERGGQWQENMDIKFLFIVGTPVRDVKDITQLWRQPGNCNYNQIITDFYFEPRNVMMNATASYFKVRSMITGHGQEGEFIPRVHSLNVNGGANEFEWTLYKKCASNPVYPQGGTWIYDRCGWCPGMATDLKEFDITNFVTPGQSALVDYHMLPVVSPAIGNSNYIVTEQLVSYGAINFTLDAAVLDIMAPSSKIEYIRQQSICASPKILIQNTGSTALTSLRIEYWINDNTVKSFLNWTGHLDPLEKTEVELPTANLWVNVKTVDNDFHVELMNPNGSTDQYAFNNKMNSQFKITDVVPANFIIYHRTNTAASETSYKVFDEAGNVLLSRQGLSNTTTYRDTLNLPYGCYKFVMTDTDEDGISFWNNSDGAGVLKFLRSNGTTLKLFNPDFGATIEYNFTVDFPLSYDDLVEANELKIYPNPATDRFTIEAPEIEDATIVFSNSVGQQITIPFAKSIGKVSFDTSHLSSGVYVATITRNGKSSSRKIVIE